MGKLANLEINGFEWKSQVRSMLLEFYGVEDIGVRLKCHPDRVRQYVQELRENGQLKRWWPE